MRQHSAQWAAGALVPVLLHARLRTLGRLELVDGESPATVRIPTQRKRLALLAYLVLATPRGPHRRDTLLALFWPEADPDDARRSLRRSLTRSVGGWAMACCNGPRMSQVDWPLPDCHATLRSSNTRSPTAGSPMP